MTINIAKEYTKTPGGRYIVEGPYSGEDFRKTVLRPAFIKAKTAGEKLIVIMDGGYGYGTSFLEEAFGGLVRDLGDEDISDIEIVSEEEPPLIPKIKMYIREALNTQRR